jgi:hypothetical protein
MLLAEQLARHLARAGDSRIWQAYDFVGNQMPTQFDGVGVPMNDAGAYVLHHSDSDKCSLAAGYPRRVPSR